MTIIKKILIFIIIILISIIGFFVIVKPYGINLVKIIPAILNTNQKSTYDHPYLNTQQELILESVGIDTKNIPTQITQKQQECVVLILGEERAREIVDGSTPSLNEILKIKKCFE